MSHVLVTNDDGFECEAVHILASAAAAFGHVVTMVTPFDDRSGSGAAVGHIWTEVPIELEHRPVLHPYQAYAVDLPPAAIVTLALHGAFGRIPDVVLSGVNPGWNVGSTLIHSGTFGAAMTAGIHGVPSVAVSMDHRADAEGYVHWWTAASLAAAMVDDLASRSLPHGAYNLNVPNMPLHRLRGVRQTELAPAGSLWSLDVVTDNHVITATPVRSERRAAHGTDVAALRAGFASVTVFDGLTPRTIPVRALCDLVSETIDDSSRRAAMARNAHNAISSVQASLSGAAPR